MPSVNISLPEALRQFIESEARSGGYSTVSEYVRELIRADQKRKAQERLESLLVEGLESGNPSPMTESDWDAVRQVIRERRKK